MDISALRKIINGYVQNVPDMVFVNAFRLAAKEYFERTEAWQVEETLNTVAGERHYTITPSNAELSLVRTLGIKRTGNDHLCVTQDPKFDRAGKPAHYFGVNRRSIGLVPTPNLIESLTVRIAVKPAMMTDVIDDDIAYEHVDELRVGTLHYLTRQKSSEHYDLNDSMLYRQEFDTAIHQRRIDAYQAHVGANSTVKIPSF